MNQLITELGDLIQQVELARIYIHACNKDLNKNEYKNLVNNYTKFESVLSTLNKKTNMLKLTIREAEEILNGLQK
jgi:hypothetical protein